MIDKIYTKYKKRIVVQNKSNLLLKIFCEAFKHYNWLIKF